MFSLNVFLLQSAGLIVTGLGLAAVGFAGRYIVRQMPQVTRTVNEAIKNLPKFDADSVANSKYYKGGFDAKMNRREAALILGKQGKIFVSEET